MNVRFDYKPLPVHEPFHKDTSLFRVMFGAYGSGKSWAVIAEAIAWCLEQPGIMGCIVRKTIPQLRDAEEPIVMQLIPYELLKLCTIRRSGGHVERIIFPNGSHLLFRSTDDPVKWRSLNLGFVCFDEMNEQDEDGFNEIYSRVRQTDLTAEALALGYTHKITRRGIWGATNPAGHDWIWRLFHPDSPDRKQGHACFTSTTLDNPYLPPEFVEGLLDMPTMYIARYVMCQFDDFAGRIYEEWNDATHVIDHIEFPPGNQEVFWMGFDPGTRSENAGLWVWLDKENRRLVGVAEYEEAGLSAEVHAQNWRRIEARHRMRVRWRVADPNSVTQRDRGTQLPLDRQYAKFGFNFTLGASSDKDRIPALGQLIHRRQFVVTRNCPLTAKAIREYQWEDLTPTQKAKGIDAPEKVLKKNTHLVECAQYLAGREIPKPKLSPYHDMDDREAWNYEIHEQLRKDRRATMRRRTTSKHDLGVGKI